MSWSRRSLLLTPLALAACGFTPALGSKGPAEGLFGTVYAADPGDKNGFDFVQRMEERLGHATNPLYDLTYSISTNAVGVGVLLDGSITRFNLLGSVNWTLTRRADKARMAGGNVSSFTSFSATGTTVTGLTGQTEASLRLMQLLADDVVTRLLSASPHFPK